MNNFKKWAEEENVLDRTPPNNVERNVKSSVGIFVLIGNVIELFLPKAMDVMKSMIGGKEDDPYRKTYSKGNIADKKPPKYPNKGH